MVSIAAATVLGSPAGTAAQATDIDDAVAAGMRALTSGDLGAYLSQFSPQARAMISLRSVNEVDIATFATALSGLSWTPAPVESRILGGTAIVVLRLEGTMSAAAFGSLEGPWRYAETRSRVGGAWRIDQAELSPLEPLGEAPGADESSAVLGPRPATPRDPPVEEPRSAGEARAATDQPAPPTMPPDAPPPPAFPDVISRDGAGNATVRAIRLDRPLDLDGNLDEPVYQQIPPLDDFIQSLPDEGEPATELTEAWIFYDDDNVYVSARVHEDVPESQWSANEMRRDAMQVSLNDNFGLVFDTYYDRRNGYFFYTNPLGAMVDVQVTNEGSPNFDWNPIWDVRTGRFDGGWTVEVRIPFKSIRYSPGTSQLWGVQLRRAIRRKNEWSHLTLVSRQAAGDGRMGIIRMSRAATLVGIEAPPAGVNIDIKPYGIGSVSTDRPTGIHSDLDGDGGVDLKWAVTQNLAADFTYNTDFAQVEVDEQQVNLTRFSLLFPEKREFFLESRGIFNFPASGVGGGGGGGRGGGATPQLFFSRRIGLLGRTPVPIRGGGRVTGKIGPLDIGALDIVTGDVDDIGAVTTNFTVARVRADILARSNIGALYTRRSESLVADGASETFGADLSLAFFDDWYLSGYFARTRTPGIDSLDVSYQGRFAYDGDLLGLSASHLLVEDDFNPEVGFRRRWGFRQSNVQGRFSPRPRSIESIRQITLQGGVDYYENAQAGYVESRDIGGGVTVELENSDRISADYTNGYENLVTAATISGAAIPAGRYAFDYVQGSYQFGPQRFFSGTLGARYGEWYSGHLTTVGFSRGRIEVTPQLSLEPSVSVNWIDVPGAKSTTTLALTRLTYTFTPRMFLSTLLQYNTTTDTFSTNARFRWEWAPGSEIFLVFTEERDTYDFERFPVMSNQGFVVKVTRLLRL